MSDYDEGFNTQRDVEQNPCGAWQAIQELTAERDALRQRKRELLDRLAWVEGERISWRERAEKAEAKRDEYHDIANVYAAWAGDILELLEDKLGDLDMNSPSDEALKRLMDRAQAGIASEIRRSRAVLRQDEGGE